MKDGTVITRVGTMGKEIRNESVVVAQKGSKVTTNSLLQCISS